MDGFARFARTERPRYTPRLRTAEQQRLLTSALLALARARDKLLRWRRRQRLG